MKVATSISTIADTSPDKAESDDDDPDANTDCINFETAAECGTKGCSWTDAFVGEHDERLEEKEDGSDEVTGYVCVDDEEVREELRDRTNVNETSSLQVQEDQSEVANSVRWCRRRSQRWSCPYARRRRAPRIIPRYAGDPKGKAATQSSTSCDGSATRAIDGNGDNWWSGGSCTHTGGDINPWWQVDLGSPQHISGVRITNRGDCCGERLNGFNLLMDGKSCAQNVGIKTGENKTVPCAGSGQVLRVQVPRPNVVLTLCEFEVIRAPTQTPTPATTQASGPVRGPWECASYVTGQDDAWCATNPTVAGVEYNFFKGDGTCGGCWCCKRTITTTPTVEPGQLPSSSPSASASPTPSLAPGASPIFDHIDKDGNNMIDQNEWKSALDKEKEVLGIGKTTPSTPTDTTPSTHPASTPASSTHP